MHFKHFLVIIFVLISYLSFSQENTLVVFSAEGMSFNLFVNGEKINQTPQSNIKAFEISFGWQQLKIEMIENEKLISFSDSIKIKQGEKFNNREYTFALIKSEKGYELKFISISDISAPKNLYIPEAPKEKDPNIDNSKYGIVYRAKNNKPDFFENYNSETQECDTSLTDHDVEYAVRLFKKTNDKEALTRYITKVITNNCYTAKQAYTILDNLTLEMDRLNISKIAFYHLSDKQNAKQLENLFKYQSLKESFQTFLKELSETEMQKSLQCKNAIAEPKFQTIYNKIKSTPYDYEKLKEAKKHLVNNCMSSQQIKKISDFFHHDREKLELFKFSYYIITDKDAYQSLQNELQFQESKTDFSNFLTKLSNAK
jgi:hypothetical protein